MNPFFVSLGVKILRVHRVMLGSPWNKAQPRDPSVSLSLGKEIFCILMKEGTLGLEMFQGRVRTIFKTGMTLVPVENENSELTKRNGEITVKF